MIRRVWARRAASKARDGVPRSGPTPRWAQPIEVPPCPDGWRTGPPDFVGIGAQRSGTSWWYRGIEAHPRVVRVKGQRKELHYFNRFWNGEVPPRFADRYHSLFPRPPGSITGEWTPRYMHDHWSVPLLSEAAPDARVLVILRDPVERYRSGAARMVRLAEELERPLRLIEISDALWRSFYYEQLSRVFELFGRDQVLVLQFERCLSDPEGEMRATCRFLGLEPLETPPRQLTRERPPREKPVLPERMREELVRRLADDVGRLARLCPEIDLSLWPNFSHLASRS
jgi:Sulfotransferase family